MMIFNASTASVLNFVPKKYAYFADKSPGSILELLVVTIFVAGVVRLILYHRNKWRMYVLSAKVKGPVSYPIIGSAYELFGSNKDIFEKMLSLEEKYGSTYKLWLGPNLVYMLSNIKDIEILLTSYKAINKAYSYEYLEPFIGVGVFSAKLERWRKLRRIMEPTFSKKVIESFMEIFSTESMNLVQQLKQEIVTGNRNFYDCIGKCTLDVLCEAAMGVKMNSQQYGTHWFYSLNRGMEIVIQRMLKPWLQFDFIFNLTADGKLVNKNMAEFRNYSHKILSSKKKVLADKESEITFTEEPVESKRKAFLDLLLEVKDKSYVLSDKELVDEILLFLIAGTDSTTTTTCYVLEMLAIHPKYQDLVYQEVVDIVGYNDRTIDYNDLSRMTYMEMFVKETMRILPTIPVIGRHVMEELKLDSCTLPRGATASIDILNIHRNPNIYPNPMKFDPERFSAENIAKENRSPFAYLPFSAGPRNCIGLRFAMVEIKTFIAYIIRQYRITTTYGTVDDIKLAINFMIKPVDGFKFNLTPREENDNLPRRLV